MTGTLYITEFGQIQAYPTLDTAQIAKAPAITSQAVAISSTTAAVCTAFNANTQIVRLTTDTNCWVVFSAVGSATVTAANATSMPLWANTVEYFGVDTLRGVGPTPVTQVVSVLSSA